MVLTDEQWKLIEPLLPRGKTGPKGGRPRRNDREIADGILWILRTGAPWKDLPHQYPPYQTCHRRFQEWVGTSTLDKILHVLATDLRERGKLDLTEAFIDGSFAAAKKGGLALARPSAARAPRSWVSQTATVFLSPWGLRVLRRMRPSSSTLPSTPRSSTKSLKD